VQAVPVCNMGYNLIHKWFNLIVPSVLHKSHDRTVDRSGGSARSPNKPHGLPHKKVELTMAHSKPGEAAMMVAALG